MKNLFLDLPAALTDELVEVLAASEHVRVERIVSTGHSSPEGYWYDEAEHEWVIVLQGEAKLQLEGDGQAIHLTPGDHINIPAHRKHRVAWTTPGAPTVWLAVFYTD